MYENGYITNKNDVLDVFTLFHRLFKQYRIKNIWSPPRIEPRTACIAHKRSATELQQPPGEQTHYISCPGFDSQW